MRAGQKSDAILCFILWQSLSLAKKKRERKTNYFLVAMGEKKKSSSKKKMVIGLRWSFFLTILVWEKGKRMAKLPGSIQKGKKRQTPHRFFTKGEKLKRLFPAKGGSYLLPIFFSRKGKKKTARGEKCRSSSAQREEEKALLFLLLVKRKRTNLR